MHRREATEQERDEMTKRNNKQEAWELLASAEELPEGWDLEDQGNGEWFAFHVGVGACTLLGSTREKAIEQAWEVVGGRQRYAEMTAIDRVREAAIAALGDELRGVELSDEVRPAGDAWFIVYAQRDDEGWSREHCRGHGPTICDAAVACLRDLGALEVGDAD